MHYCRKVAKFPNFSFEIFKTSYTKYLNRRLACRRFVVACSQEQCFSRTKESRIKKREKFNCNTVTTEAWADPRRCCGAGRTFKSCLLGAPG